MRIIYDNNHEPDMGRYRNALVEDNEGGISHLYDDCGVYTTLPQDARLKHNFTNQSTIIVEHGLKKYPSVTIVDSNGEVVIGDVDYNNINKATISLSEPLTGFIALN